MRLVFSLLALLGASIALGETEARPRYKRFPETVSPDGAYSLAWGHKLAEGADPATLAEVPYTTHLDPAAAEIQDYLVETKRVQPPLSLPQIEYFSGLDGHEDKRGLTFAWSPDSKGVLVIYESDHGCLQAAWADPVARRVTAVGKTLEAALRSLVAERFGEDEEKTRMNVFFNRVAVLGPGLLTLDGCLTQLTDQLDQSVAYWFRLRFKIVTDDEATHFEMVKNHILLADDLLTPEVTRKGETVDGQLDKALEKLRGTLAPPAREALKKEQALWLKQREAMANAWNRKGFTQHRLEELKIRAAEQ